MTERGRRSVWFYVFGCTPTTGVLLIVLFSLIALPVVLDRWMRGNRIDEPKAFHLPNERDGRAFVLLDEEWGWSRDVDGDAREDCFCVGGPLGKRFVADGSKRACIRSGPAWVSSLGGVRDLDDAFRRVLDDAARYKRERGWLPVSVTDPDGDGAVDCVMTRDPMGLVLRREGAACPYDAWSLPEAIESHDRLAEFQALLVLETAIRDGVLDRMGGTDRAGS